MSVAPQVVSPTDLRGCVRFDGVRWPTYLRLSRSLSDRRLRITFDQGSLDILSPSFQHETCKEWLGSIVRVLAEEFGHDIVSAGSTTFRRRDLERGLEPDQCFYIAHAAKVLGKKRISLDRDPPPDLVIEIDLAERLVDRLPIYAAMGVPEIWCYDGSRLDVFRLGESANYDPAIASVAFPEASLSQIAETMAGVGTMTESEMIRTFRQSIQQSRSK